MTGMESEPGGGRAQEPVSGEGRPWGSRPAGPVHRLRLEPDSGSSGDGNRLDVEAEPCWGAFGHSLGEEAPEPLRVTKV